MCSHVICAEFNLLWVLNRCMMSTNEKSHIHHDVYLRSSRLSFWHFWLDSYIANKGEKFELVLGYWMHLEGFQVVSSHFWALLHTSLTGRGHRSDRSECWPCSYVGHRSDRWW
jgi:hypothetical protein